MVLVQRAGMTVLVRFMAMPLLTELVSSEGGFCYRHGAPNGAFFSSAPSIPPKAANNPGCCYAVRAVEDLA